MAGMRRDVACQPAQYSGEPVRVLPQMGMTPPRRCRRVHDGGPYAELWSRERHRLSTEKGKSPTSSRSAATRSWTSPKWNMRFVMKGGMVVKDDFAKR